MVHLLSNQDLDTMHNDAAKESSRPLQEVHESIIDNDERANKPTRTCSHIQEGRSISKSAHALLLFALLAAAILGATLVVVGMNHDNNLHPPSDPAAAAAASKVIVVTPTTTSNDIVVRRRLQEALGTCPFQLQANYIVPALPAAAAPAAAATGAAGPLCTSPPTMFSMFFRSKSCAQAALGTQSIMNYQCQDFHGGTSTIKPGDKVYIAAIGNNNRLLYSGSHLDGTDFYIWNLFNPLPNTTMIEISSDANRTHLLQRVTFPSSCNVAGGAVLSNTFGAVQITGFTTEEQGTVNVAPSTPVTPVAAAVPPIKATFTLSLGPVAAASGTTYTLTKWQFQTNYTQPVAFLIPMEGTRLDATGVQTTLEVDTVNLARLPQTLQTTMSVTATSSMGQVCEVYLSNVHTITGATP